MPTCGIYMYTTCALSIIPLMVVRFYSYTLLSVYAEPQWLLFTSSQLVIVQIFLVMVIYIHSKLRRVVTTRTSKLSQKAQLWG